MSKWNKEFEVDYLSRINWKSLSDEARNFIMDYLLTPLVDDKAMLCLEEVKRLLDKARSSQEGQYEHADVFPEK